MPAGGQDATSSAAFVYGPQLPGWGYLVVIFGKGKLSNVYVFCANPYIPIGLLVFMWS